MDEQGAPWFVRLVVGIGAWITAVVLMFLGGAIVFVALDFERPIALAVIGAMYLGLGTSLLRQSDRGLFATQLGIATGAAGAALISGGLAAEAEEIWVGVPASVVVALIILLAVRDGIVQVIAVALVAAWVVATLIVEQVPHILDILALATPAGLYLAFNPPRRDMTPVTIVLLLTFPLFSVSVFQDVYWLRNVEAGGWIARLLHIALFVWLVSRQWHEGMNRRVNPAVLAFVITAVAVCLLLPVGGSAALLLMTFAYVVGSKPLAALGVVLQVQFIVRYYYNLDLSLLHKSLLLMAVGIVLIGAWWLLGRHREDEGRA